MALTACAHPPPAKTASRPVHDGKADDQHFRIDPVVDISLIAAGVGFSVLEELITSTGEIVPQRPGPSTDVSFIDRVAITQTVDPHAATVSNIGLATAVGFAAIDPFLSGLRHGWDASLVDFMLYAETISLTLAVTDIAKVAVRRPRPLAYTEQAALDARYPLGMSPSITDTDAQLSFFSGHAAITSSITATATYLAFVRAGAKNWRPWATLIGGSLLTGLVSIERVRAGAHFPTDVIAGTFVGVAIGILVPHLHRHQSELPRVWVGGAPMPGGAAGTIQGIF